MRIAVPLSAEWRLLLRACAAAPQTTAATLCLRQEFDDGAVDWDQFVDRASEHDIGPLVYHNLQPDGPPGDRARQALARLKAQYCATAIRNALVYRELAALLDAFRAHKNPVIVLKGAALTATVYRNLAVRPMGDVDLLIRKDDLSEVEKLLEGLGYTLEEGYFDRKEWYRTHHYHLTFQREVTAAFTMYLEIHWRIDRPTRPFAIDMNGVWARATTASFDGLDLLVMSPEDLLLHLCLHICKHRLVGGFRAFCDIAAAIRHYGPSLDWEQVRTRALEWRIGPFVYVPLRVVQELLQIDVPASALEGLAAEDCDERLVGAAIAEVLEKRVSANLFGRFFDLRYGSVAERGRVLKGVFSRAAIADRYGLPAESKEIYWYYPTRLKGVISDYGADLWRFLRRGRQTMSQARSRSQLSEWLAPLQDDTRPTPTNADPAAIARRRARRAGQDLVT